MSAGRLRHLAGPVVVGVLVPMAGVLAERGADAFVAVPVTITAAVFAGAGLVVARTVRRDAVLNADLGARFELFWSAREHAAEVQRQQGVTSAQSSDECDVDVRDAA